MNAKKELTIFLVSSGFTLKRIKNHQIWNCPCGHTQITLPLSPSDRRSDPNSYALIARTIKACEKNLDEQEVAA